MHCPLCGKILKQIEHEERDPPEVDWRAEGEELQKQMDAVTVFEESRLLRLLREEYACPEGCFGEGYPLYFHHPLRGLNSEPGDSWSLSWVK